MHGPQVDDPPESRLDRLTKSWALVTFVCSTPFLIFFYYRGEPGRGMVAMAFAITTLIVTRLFWDLRRSTWFWVSVVSTIAIHAAVVLLIPWPDSNHARGLLAIGLPDLFFVYGCFKLVEKMSVENRSPEQ